MAEQNESWNMNRTPSPNTWPRRQQHWNQSPSYNFNPRSQSPQQNNFYNFNSPLSSTPIHHQRFQRHQRPRYNYGYNSSPHFHRGSPRQHFHSPHHNNPRIRTPRPYYNNNPKKWISPKMLEDPWENLYERFGVNPPKNSNNKCLIVVDVQDDTNSPSASKNIEEEDSSLSRSLSSDPNEINLDLDFEEGANSSGEKIDKKNAEDNISSKEDTEEKVNLEN